jgi:hypothetical protein
MLITRMLIALMTMRATMQTTTTTLRGWDHSAASTRARY